MPIMRTICSVAGRGGACDPFPLVCARKQYPIHLKPLPKPHKIIYINVRFSGGDGTTTAGSVRSSLSLFLSLPPSAVANRAQMGGGPGDNAIDDGQIEIQNFRLKCARAFREKCGVSGWPGVYTLKFTLYSALSLSAMIAYTRISVCMYAHICVKMGWPRMAISRVGGQGVFAIHYSDGTHKYPSRHPPQSSAAPCSSEEFYAHN